MTWTDVILFRPPWVYGYWFKPGPGLFAKCLDLLLSDRAFDKTLQLCRVTNAIIHPPWCICSQNTWSSLAVTMNCHKTIHPRTSTQRSLATLCTQRNAPSSVCGFVRFKGWTGWFLEFVTCGNLAPTPSQTWLPTESSPELSLQHLSEPGSVQLSSAVKKPSVDLVTTHAFTQIMAPE